MIKKLFLILCALVLCSSSYAGNIKDIKKVIARKNVASCDTETYNPTASLEESLFINIGYNRSYMGIEYRPASNQCVCRVEVYNTDIIGTMTAAHEYYMWISSIGASNSLDGVTSAVSAKVEGLDMTTNTWQSWTFSPCINLTQDARYGFAWMYDADGDPETAPVLDETNYWRIAIDDERELDTIQYGSRGWAWDAAIPFDQTSSDVEDDILIKVYTQ